MPFRRFPVLCIPLYCTERATVSWASSSITLRMCLRAYGALSEMSCSPRQSLAAIQRIEKPSAVQRQIMRAEAANVSHVVSTSLRAELISFQMNGFEGMGLFAAGQVLLS